MTEDTLIVSNWKMNLNIGNANKLINSIIKLNLPKSKKIKNIICPQFLLIPFISRLIVNKDITLGSQDCHFEKEGAFTGDTSVELIKYFKCKYIILGHSERRNFHFEKNKIIKKKVEIALKAGLIPIICIGESFIERKKNYIKVLSKQLEECVPDKLNKTIVIAYEPIWSIGSGVTPTYDEILKVKEHISEFLMKKKNISDVKILYGGSVSSKNFSEIMTNTGVNGALIGSASIDSKQINKILSYCYFD